MFHNLKKILVPVDFSEPSRRAVLLACDIAQRYGAEVTLLNVYQVPGFVYPDGFMAAGPETMRDLMAKTQEALDTLKASALRAGATRIVTKATEGTPHVEVLGEAKAGEFDLIVMGTHGRTGFMHAFMGSVAENVVRRSECPVLTVRAPKEDVKQAAA